MGKLLSGRYGSMPDAESIPLTLRDCHQQLNLKPSDFVSEGPPKFFEKAFGASGRYLLFLPDDAETNDSSVWKPGYYLLPLEARAALETLRKHLGKTAESGAVLPIEWEDDASAAESLKEKALRWADGCQPLFFKCGCQKLLLKLAAPWALRRRWRARLRCPKRCQPSQSVLL